MVGGRYLMVSGTVPSISPPVYPSSVLRPWDGIQAEIWPQSAVSQAQSDSLVVLLGGWRAGGQHQHTVQTSEGHRAETTLVSLPVSLTAMLCGRNVFQTIFGLHRDEPGRVESEPTGSGISLFYQNIFSSSSQKTQ